MRLEPITTPRRSAAGAIVNNFKDGSPEAWVVGGVTANGPVDLVEVYSLSWGDWRQEASMLQPRAHHGAAALGGNLFVGGGEISCGGTAFCQTEKVEMYAPSTKTWSQVSSLSQARKGLAFASDEASGLLYALGGVDCGGDCSALSAKYLGTAEVYNPATQAWTLLPPMPTPRADLSAGVVDSKLYAVGGCGGEGNLENCSPLAVVEMYDPATNTWTSVSPLVQPRHGFTLGTYGSQLIIAGGSSSVGMDAASAATNLTKTVDVFDVGDSLWYPLTRMPDPREGLVAGNLFVGISMLLISGETADASLSATNEYMALMCASALTSSGDKFEKLLRGNPC